MKRSILREMFLAEDDGAPAAALDVGDTQPNAAPSPTADASTGLRVSGDKATLGALQDALQEAASSIRDNDDLADWCERAYKAAAMGIRRGGGSVTLPNFEETPELGSFNDDAGIGPDEEI